MVSKTYVAKHVIHVPFVYYFDLPLACPPAQHVINSTCHSRTQAENPSYKVSSTRAVPRMTLSMALRLPGVTRPRAVAGVAGPAHACRTVHRSRSVHCETSWFLIPIPRIPPIPPFPSLLCFILCNTEGAHTYPL